MRGSRRLINHSKAKEEKHALVQAIVDGRQEGVKKTKIKGNGRAVVTTRTFLKGEFVLPFAGELISEKTAKQREKEYSQKREGNYLFYFRYHGKKLCCDATDETTAWSGTLGRLLNHSRVGNLNPKVIAIEGKPQLYFIAKSNIPQGVEIVFDYGERTPQVIKNMPWLGE